MTFPLGRNGVFLHLPVPGEGTRVSFSHATQHVFSLFPSLWSNISLFSSLSFHTIHTSWFFLPRYLSLPPPKPFFTALFYQTTPTQTISLNQFAKYPPENSNHPLSLQLTTVAQKSLSKTLLNFPIAFNSRHRGPIKKLITVSFNTINPFRWKSITNIACSILWRTNTTRFYVFNCCVTFICKGCVKTLMKDK